MRKMSKTNSVNLENWREYIRQNYVVLNRVGNKDFALISVEERTLELIRLFEQLLAAKERELDKIKRIPNLDEWITINDLLRIMIVEDINPGYLAGSNDYWIEKLTTDLHSKYRKLRINLTSKDKE